MVLDTIEKFQSKSSSRSKCRCKVKVQISPTFPFVSGIELLPLLQPCHQVKNQQLHEPAMNPKSSIIKNVDSYSCGKIG